MNAKFLSVRAGMLFAVAAMFSTPASAGSPQPVVQPQTLAFAAQKPEAVLDSGAVAPIDLMLFVHRPDLPLRAVPTKHKDHS
ncbi:MAG: hypothetical protein ACLGH1_04070 [Gammaproteobacteria bacterium]|jgi:hypothetical protein